MVNLRNRLPVLARAGQRLTGLSAARALPAWRRDAFRDHEIPHRRGTRPEILLFADTFNRWFEPENLRAALRVLTAAGVDVAAPRSRRPLCCGRTRLAVGDVAGARAEAQRTLAALAGDRPVIGLEPSCLLTLRDEFPALLPGPDAEHLAGRAMLLSEYLHRTAMPPLRPLSRVAHLHGHCHQKAHGALPAALAMLKKIPTLDVRPIDAGCCGMAGSFGYQAETQAESRAMAELGLLPAVRGAAVDAVIVADGTSCRHQIAELAGRRAVHSVLLLDEALASS